MKRLAGTIMVVTFIIFFIGVAQPVIGEVFDTTDANEQLQYMEANPEQWRFANIMMGISGIIAAVGVVIFVAALQNEGNTSQIMTVGYASALLIIVGAVAWMFVCYSRVTLPMVEVAGNQDINDWLGGFNALTFLISIVLIGYICIQKLSKWVGIIVIVVEVGLSLMSFIAIGTVPIAIHYLALVILGATLIIKGGKQRIQNPMSSSPELQSQS